MQITAVANIGNKSGYNSRRWTKHGKLPYVTYETASASSSANKATYTIGRTNAPVNVREKAGITAKVVTKLAARVQVKLTGKTVNESGITWVEVLYNGKLCWCDKQWINS